MSKATTDVLSSAWARWHNARRPRRTTSPAQFELLETRQMLSALYWDTSATAGLQAGSGTWSTGTVCWNTASDGSGTRVAWTDGSDAVFSSSGTSTVTIPATVTANSITISGTGYTVTGGTLTLGGGSSTGSIAASASATVSSVLAGSVGLNKSGAGTLTLNASNTFTGQTRITGGTLTLGNASTLATSTLNMAGGDTGTISFGTQTTVVLGGLAGSRNLGIGSASVKLGSDGDDTVYSGVLSGSASGIVTKQGSGTLTLTGQNTYPGSLRINAGTVSFAAGALSAVAAISFPVSNATLQWYGTNTDDLSAQLAAIPTGLTATFDTGANVVTFNNVISGTGGIAKSGAGSLALLGTNTYTGGTTLHQGTLAFTSGGLGASGTIGFDGDATLRWRGGNTQDISARFGAIPAGVTATLDTGSADLTFATGLTGAGNVTKVSTSALTLSVSSALTGTLQLAQGTLNLGVINALLNSTLAMTGGTLKFGGLTQAKIGALQGSGNVSLANDSSGAVLLMLGNMGLNSAYSGSLSGIGSLRINGGMDTLTGANAYSGTTEILAGALSIGSGGTTGSLGSGAVTDNTSLVFNRTDAVAVANAISGTGSLTKQGSGTLTLSGSDTYTGSTSVTAGTLVVNGALAAGSAVSVSSGATLTGTGTIAGPVTLASGGNLQPTAGLGILHVGNLALPAGSTLALALNGNTAGTQYGQISVTGTANLTGSTLSLTGGRTNDDGHSLILIANDGTDPIVGTFAGLPQGAAVTVNGVAYTLLYTGGDGNDVVLTDVNMSVAISGPSTANEGDLLNFASTITGTPDAITYGWSVNKDTAPLTLPGGSVTNQSGLTFIPPDDGSYDIIVQVWDTHAHAASSTHPLQVADVPPSVSMAGNAGVDEGRSYSLQVGSIVDPGGDKVTEYRVNWGDGNTSIYTAAQVQAGGRYLAHVYTDEQYTQKTITVDLQDEDGPAETGGWHIARGTLVVQVNDAAPTATLANDGPVDQYSPVAISFADASDSLGDMAAGLHYSYALDPADLAGTYPAATDGASKTFTLGDAGTHTVYGRVFDQEGVYTEYTADVTVNAVVPDVAVVATSWQVLPGGSITLSSVVAYNGNPGADQGISYAWTITKDGSPYLSSTDATLTFTPQDVGEYEFSLTATDSSSGVSGLGEDYFNVVPFTAAASGADTVTAGQSYTLNLATAGPGATNVTSWSIDWGDGSDVQEVDGSPLTVTHVFNAGAMDTSVYASATDGTSTYYADPVPRTVASDWASLSVTGDASVAAGGTYTLSLGITYPAGSAGAVSQWSIDWGDGFADAPDVQIVSGDATSVTHVFAPGVAQAMVFVTATDVTGDYDAAPVFVSVTGVVAIPPAPVDVIVSPYSSTELDLSWTGSSGVRSFNISRSDDGGQTWTLMGTVDGDQTSYADTGLTSGAAYAYQVTASSDGGISGVGTGLSGNGSGISAAASTSSGKPTLTVSEPDTAGSVTVSWDDKDQNVVGFELEQKQGGLGENFHWVGPPDGDATKTLTLSSLLAEQTYEFRLRADFADGTVSDYTPTQSVTIPLASDPDATLPAPTDLQVSGQDGLGNMTLSWAGDYADDVTFLAQHLATDPYQVNWVFTIGLSGTVTHDPVTGRYSAPISVGGGGLPVTVLISAHIYATGDFSPSTPITVTSAGTTVPAPALSGSPASDGSGRIVLSWSGVPDDSMVEVYVADAGDAGPGKAHFVARLPASFRQMEVTPGTSGQRFFAMVGTGPGYGSAYSNFVPADGSPVSAPVAPAFVKATYDSSGANGQVKLAWANSSANETGFKIYRSDNGGPLTLVKTVDADITTYTEQAANPWPWIYKVVATNAAGDSAGVTVSVDPKRFAIYRCPIKAQTWDEYLAGLVVSHGFIATEPVANWKKDGDRIGEGIHSKEKAGELADSELYYPGRNYVLHQQLYRQATPLKYGSGKGKLGTQATDEEIIESINLTPMRLDYWGGYYDCRDWAEDAAKASGLGRYLDKIDNWRDPIMVLVL